MPLGLGYPGWPAPSTSWDWWPFVGMACALVLILGLRLRVGGVVVVAVLASGPLFATFVHRWGVLWCLGPVALAYGWLALVHRSPPKDRGPGSV